MNNPLNRRLIRDIRKNIGRYIAIIAMLIVSISVLTGFLAMADAVSSKFYKNRKDCKVEDGQFTSVNQIPDEIITQADRLNIQVEKNFYFDKTIVTPRKSDGVVLRLFEKRQEINKETIISGSTPMNKNEIAIDRLFAQNNSLEIGDYIEIGGNKMLITGTICAPDYSGLFEKNSNLTLDSCNFGISVVSDETFSSMEDVSSVKYNYSYYFKDRSLSEKEKTAISKNVVQGMLKENIEITNYLVAADNQAISFVSDDMGSDIPMMKILCYLFIVVMAFVFAVVVCTTIDEESNIIGSLLANGYSKVELIKHYMSIPILVTIGGAVIGNLLGYLVMPRFFSSMYYNSYSIPYCTVKVTPEALVLTTLIPVLLMLVINFGILYKKLSNTPLNFLRHDLKRHKNKKPIRLPEFKFFTKFRIRIILQNKASYFMLFIGIFMASFLLLFGTCITPVLNNYMDSVKKSSFVDYQYVINKQLELDEDSSKNAEKFEIGQLNTYYKPAGKDYEITVYGISGDSQFLDDIDTSSTSIEGNTVEVYFSSDLLKKIHAKKGDEIKFRNPLTDKEYKFKIVGEYKYSGTLTVFMSIENLNKLLENDKSYFNGYFSNEPLNIQEKNILSLMTPEDLTKASDQMVLTFKQIEPMMTIIAVAIYLSLMYILTKIVIDKNTTNISYMKVFGYNKSEIRKLYLKATTIVVLLSLIVNIPIEYYGLKVLFELAFLRINSYVEADIGVLSYVKIVIIGIISYCIINFIHVKRLDKVKMSDALKARE